MPVVVGRIKRRVCMSYIHAQRIYIYRSLRHRLHLNANVHTQHEIRIGARTHTHTHKVNSNEQQAATATNNTHKKHIKLHFPPSRFDVLSLRPNYVCLMKSRGGTGFGAFGEGQWHHLVCMCVCVYTILGNIPVDGCCCQASQFCQ